MWVRHICILAVRMSNAIVRAPDVHRAYHGAVGAVYVVNPMDMALTRSYIETGRRICEGDSITMSTTQFSQEVEIELAAGRLTGILDIPPDARGLVVFAHGSGSSRLSPRNQQVARQLGRRGLATLLVDLLTEEEDVVDARTRHLRFNIPMLAERLAAIIEQVSTWPGIERLPIGLFGASTGAAAALIAARSCPRVAAVVSRGGRPDLAVSVLRHVRVPTLLIVGELDEDVLQLNQAALQILSGPRSLAIVPGATHLFEEPGALEEVSRLAARWFLKWLAPVVNAS